MLNARSLRNLLLILLGFVMLALPGVTRADMQTHYWLARPIPSAYVTRIQRGFPYGWTRNGTSPIHHGVDMLNRLGVPVIAAADGIVYYAGPDTDRVFGPYPNFYGSVVVIQHPLTAPDGGTVYTLYGHLSEVEVGSGQPIKQGQEVGKVGKAGIAQWYHLHFEVRVDKPQDYNAVRNPELWYAPEPGRGTLVGRMVDSNGGLAMGIRFVITTPISVVPGWTYADPAIPSDPVYGENFTIGDLTAGCYRFRVRNGHGGYAYDNSFCIASGQTLFLPVQLAAF